MRVDRAVGRIRTSHQAGLVGRLALFGGLDGVRFRRQVLPGERLDLEVELGRISARAGKGSGRALVGDEEACRCDLMFVFVEGD